MKICGGGKVLRTFSRNFVFVQFVVFCQLLGLAATPVAVTYAAADSTPSDQDSIESSANHILEQPLRLEEADAFGTIGTRFELFQNGSQTDVYQFDRVYGELADRPTLILGKNSSDLRVELIRNSNTQKTEAHLIYQRDGILFKKWAGSRMIVGGAGHDFIDSVADENMILLLDRSGRIYMIDRVNLRRLYGQYACPLWHVGDLKVEANAEYRLHIKKGTLEESSINAELDPRLAKDLTELEHRTIKDGSLFVTKKAENKSKVIEYFGRDQLLQAAYVSQAKLLAILEDFQVFNNKQSRQMDGIIIELASYLDAELQTHPEIFKNAEKSEVQRTLLAIDPQNTLKGIESLRTQLANTRADQRHTLLEWISNNSPHKSEEVLQDQQRQESTEYRSRARKFRETGAYQRLKEVSQKLISPASLLILSLIGFTAAGGVLKDYAAQPHAIHAFKSAILILQDIFPGPFNDEYRPTLLKSLTLQYSFAATILFGFGVAATLMKKSLDYATVIGVRLAGILTISPFYYIYRSLGQKNALFAARNSIQPNLKNGGLHRPFSKNAAEAARENIVRRAQSQNRRRALARLLAFAAISEEEGISFHALNFLSIRLARLKHAQAQSAAASAEARIDYESALESMDPVEIAKAEYEVESAAAGIALEFKNEDEQTTKEMKLLSFKTDSFLAEARAASTDLPTASEINLYRERAKEILEKTRNSSTARTLLDRGILSLQSIAKYDLPYHLNLFGLDIFRETLLRAQPSPVVGGQILSQWWVDTLATQFVLEAFWTGWPFEHMGSRADFRHPEELFAQSDGFAFTHPGQNISFFDNHAGYLISLQARAMYELGSSGEIENPYAVPVPPTPANEEHESAGKSMMKWFKIIFQPRLANYRSFFQTKRENVFRFLPLNTVLMSTARKIFLTGASITNIPFMVYFYQSTSMWAYGWPWAPIQLGITQVGERNAARYSEFTQLREKFKDALSRNHKEDADRYANRLIEFYDTEKVSLAALEQLKKKSISDWSLSEMNAVSEETFKMPAIHKAINKGVQEGLNMMGGYITTCLAIPFMMFAIRPDMNWPLFGAVAGSVALLGYPMIDKLFQWQSKWAEKNWDMRLRKKKADEREQNLKANYAYEGSKILARYGELDYEKASPKQRERILKYREHVAKLDTPCAQVVNALTASH